MEARKRIPVTESSGSVQRWPPTSGKDWAGPRRGTGSEARFRQTRGTDDRCPPKRDDSAKTTGGRAEDTSMADQTRDSVDSPLGPQDRRPNQRTTPQLLATKVLFLSLSSFLTRVTRDFYFCKKRKREEKVENYRAEFFFFFCEFEIILTDAFVKFKFSFSNRRIIPPAERAKPTIFVFIKEKKEKRKWKMIIEIMRL